MLKMLKQEQLKKRGTNLSFSHIFLILSMQRALINGLQLTPKVLIFFQEAIIFHKEPFGLLLQSLYFGFQRLSLTSFCFAFGFQILDSGLQCRDFFGQRSMILRGGGAFTVLETSALFLNSLHGLSENAKLSYVMVQPIYHEGEEKHKPHERSFEKVLGHEDLFGGIDNTGLSGTALDLGHTVEARSEDDDQCGADGGDDDGATAALEAIQGEDEELPEWGLEKEKHDQKHFAEDRGVE